MSHLLFRKHTSDFWEMNLHHLITITLYGGMIMQNFIRCGVVVSFLHCLSDIGTAGSRVFSHTVYKQCTRVSFILCTVCWFIFRNRCIPQVCYAAWLYLKYPADGGMSEYNIAPQILVSFLTVLCFMHVYWLTLFL